MRGCYKLEGLKQPLEPVLNQCTECGINGLDVTFIEKFILNVIEELYHKSVHS